MALSERFSEALAYAARLHAGQVRKASNVPYLAHLLAVASLVLEHGGSEVEGIAALLHDAVEDQGGPATREEIHRRFGPEVVAIVDACTDSLEDPKPPWRQRKEAHLAAVRQADASARLVLAADKLHNALAIAADYQRHGERLWSRFRGGRAGTLWYYRAMLDALAAQGSSPLLDRLRQAVTELERLGLPP